MSQFIRFSLAMVLVGCGSLPRQTTEPLFLSADSPYTRALLSDLSDGVVSKGQSLKCLPEPSTFVPFLRGERKVFLSSRFISYDEIQLARDDGVLFLEVPLALSGVVIAVSADNSFAWDITIEELRRLWRKGSTLKSWKDVRAIWPPKGISLYGPPKGSPAHRYFSEALFGGPEQLREDYSPFAEGNIGTALRGGPWGMAFLAFPEYWECQDSLRALAIESGKGAVLPSQESFEDRSYTPFTIPVLLYINANVMEVDVLRSFIQWIFSDSARSQLVRRGFVPLPPELARLSQERFLKRVMGSLLEPPRKGADKLRDFLTAEW